MSSSRGVLVPADDWPVSVVEEIGDGDTITVWADQGGPQRGIEYALRLVVVDTPEMKDRDPAVRERAAQARQASVDWLAERCRGNGAWASLLNDVPVFAQPGALRVTLQRRPSGAYLRTFTRWMADLYDPRTGESLSSHLLATGHAVVWGSRQAGSEGARSGAWTGLPREWDDED